MKRFSLWLVLFGLFLVGCGRGAGERLPKLPEDKTVMLSICEEEQYSQKYLYTKKEVRALNKALARASVQPVDDWTIPEDPWPVYGLYVTDLWHDGRELDAACFGDLWVDNQGQAFRVEGLDMQALTDLFPDGWKEGKHNRCLHDPGRPVKRPELDPDQPQPVRIFPRKRRLCQPSGLSGGWVVRCSKPV